MTTPTYLKVVSKDGNACHGGEFDYTPHLPTETGPGLELPHRQPVICKSGWHWCTPESLMDRWAKAGMRVFEAQPSDDVTRLDGDGKCVSSSGQLLKPYPTPGWWQSSITFIAELPSIPWCQPDGEPDPAWRLFTAPTLAAAWDAGRDAAWDAGRDAAWDAGRAAAWDAGRAAAWDAAWDAGRDAAWDAARAAAWDAARDAGRAAARAAAWDAARAAARAAAWDAAVYTGTHHICEGIELDQTHRDTAAARWNAWTKGYCVLGEVDGVLYVYAKDVPA